MNKFQKAPAQQFGRPVSRDTLDRGAVVKHGSVNRNYGDDIREILNEIAEALFAAAEHGSSLAPVADIAENAQHCRPSAPIGSAGTYFDGHGGSVRTQHIEFAAASDAFFRSQNLRGRASRRIELRFRHAHEPFGEFQHLAGGAVGFENAARLGIDDEDRVVGGVDQVPVFLFRTADLPQNGAGKTYP